MLKILKSQFRRVIKSRADTKKPSLGTSLWDRSQVGGETKYPVLHYDDEQAARQALGLVDRYTMSTYPRMVTLWQQVRYLDRAGIAGSLVECGTWRGGSAGMMALAHLAGGQPTRQIHLFDSFEGLPEPDQRKDGEYAVQYASGRASGSLDSIERCVGPLEDNQYLMHSIVKYPLESTIYHVGWFQNTLPEAAPKIGPIALLRLDGDWYESTRICLETLYPYVKPGGIVVIDDYGHWEGCRKAVDEFMEEHNLPLFLHHIDPSARYLVVPT